MKNIFINSRNILFLLLVISATINTLAEDHKYITIGVNVLDKITNRRLSAMDVWLYTATDTTQVKKIGSGSERCHFESRLSPVPKAGTKYLLKVETKSPEGMPEVIRQIISDQGPYETQWVDFIIPEDHDGYVEVPTVKMSRPKRKAPEQLKEVTVTASKVMFYHKGDTLIYNADAFVLAEGSMLDALITQLPGVELKSDGRIFCNGRFVDNLLLNGRDLFNGNNELMLENLAAYTVKNIAVYDKLGRDSKLLGFDAGDKKYVMDVRLKRQYANGWIVNAEGGYGTEDRYLGRLFGLWFSDNASISAFGGANNLSDRSEPGRDDGSWSPERMESGVTTRYMGGIIYTAKGLDDKWDLSGSVKYENSKLKSITNTTAQNFFDSGDTYQYMWRNMQNKNWLIETNHKINLTVKKKINIGIRPTFSYSDRSINEASTSALFSREIQDISEQMVKNIYTSGDSLSKHLINRNVREMLSSGKNLYGNVFAYAFMPLGGRSKRQSLRLEANMNYNNRKDDRFNRYQIDYADASMPDAKASQYFKGHPDWDKGVWASAKYVRYLSEGSNHLDILYKYTYRAERRTSILYLLDQVAGFDSFNSPLGQLPSMRDYTPFVDKEQSYLTHFEQHINEINPTWFNAVAIDKSSVIMYNISVPINIYTRRFDYIWTELDKNQRVDRTNVVAGINSFLNWSYMPKDKIQANTTFTVGLSPRLADMLNIIDRSNNTDPLNIFVGNPNLRNAYELGTSINTNLWKPGSKTEHKIMLEYGVMFNQFARGFMYNRDSGVRTYSTYNVNGNWRINGRYELFLKFGKYDRFNIQSITSPSYNESVDFAGVEGEGSGNMPPRRNVNTVSVNEELRFNWQTGRNRLTAHASGRVNRYNSSDKGFYNFTSWTCNYGLSGILNLPKDWGLSTDMTLYTRRGFTDSRLNTTDFVWNARLTKSIMKGSILFAVDAYDLLHQLSNINYVVNAQARTETVSNVIPAYVLFHVQWRFNKQPKKK